MKGSTHTFLGVPAVAESREMRQLLDAVRRIAPLPGPVLVEGESGAGKEVIARALHRYSEWSEGPWVNLNCAAMPEALLRQELFGEQGRPGMIELAHEGTLLLDEFLELPSGLQPPLIRFLETGECYRAGHTQPIRPQVRIIATTPLAPEEAVTWGRLNPGLLHRLAKFRLRVPPLRDRIEDIVPLAEHFAHSVRAGMILTDDAKQALETYSWPGNVRELSNTIHACAVTTPGEVIRTLDLPGLIQDCYAGHPNYQSDIKRLYRAVNADLEEDDSGNRGPMLHDMEKKLILQVLRHTCGHQERAANLLGISRRTLIRKLKQYGEESGVELVTTDPGMELA